MKGIICNQPGLFLIKDMPSPEKNKGQALLRIKKVGVCGTDYHAFRGQQAYFTYPRILGHELAAEILEIDRNEDDLKPGDIVTVLPYLSCHQCYACRNGKPNCCANLQVLGVHTDGGMREVISVPVELLVPARGLSPRAMAVVEPLAIGAHALNRSPLKEGDFALVMGCGPIGLGIMAQAALRGAKVIALDTNQQRLDYARQAFGIAHAVLANGNALEQVSELTGGDLAAVVFDATGNRRALEAGPDYMAAGGSYVLVGLSNGPLQFEHPKIHAKETSILCSRNATRSDFEQVIGMLREGNFPLESYITHEVDSREMIAHFEQWMAPGSGVIKAIVNF